MNEDVTTFIESINQPWQVEVCNRLRQMVHQAIPDVEERMQYKNSVHPGHVKGRFETLDLSIRKRMRSLMLKRKAHRSRVASDVPPNRRVADLGVVSLLIL